MKINELLENQIFVFGSNTEGRHGKGAALQARKFGAVYGQPMGPQGDTYAIVTKELRRSYPPIELDFIGQQLITFSMWAARNKDKEFLLLPVGTFLAGFSLEQFESVLPIMPENVIFTWEDHGKNKDS